jgi:response regulator RpfG family c-di-GMP phosphodiesterase
MGTETPVKKNQVLFVASDAHFEAMARFWLRDFNNLEFIPAPSPEILAEGAPAGVEPKLILLDGRGEKQKTFEWTQTLKMTFNAPLVVFYDHAAQLEFALLIKNGADSILHLYYDSEFIVDKLLELVSWDDDGEPALGLLNALAVEDLTTEMDVNFDVYVHLPGNQKSILVRRKGSALDQKLIDKVKSSQQNIYFKKSQMKLFLEYSRTALSLKDSSELAGVTDKIIRTRIRIQQIISQFFDQGSKDFKEGKVILDNCEQIIADLEIKKWTDTQSVVRNFVLFTGRTRSYYNDAMTLCILAAGIGHLIDLPMEQITELALAGLLHNIGLASMSHPQLDPEISKLNEIDRKEYFAYPERSVNQIKSKRVPLPQSVTELIQEHQEKPAGGGFPKGQDSSFHHANSRIIQFAFLLMDLTKLENNQPRYTLKGALSYLNEQMMAGHNLVDGTLLLKVKKKIDSAV